jgi:hypothetical protein
MPTPIRLRSVVAATPGTLEEEVNLAAADLERGGHTVLSVQVMRYPVDDDVQFAAFLTYRVGDAVTG